MINKKQAEIIEIIATIISTNLTTTKEPVLLKKVKYPLDQKEPKNYPKLKGRDQRWR